MAEKQQWTISGKDIVDKIKQVVAKGDARRLRVFHKGHPVVDIPLNVDSTAGSLAVLATLGAIEALVSEVTIEVEKADPDQTRPKADQTKA